MLNQQPQKIVVLVSLLFVLAISAFGQNTDTADRNTVNKPINKNEELTPKLDLVSKPVPQADTDSNAWHFEVAPYLWAAALEGDLRVRNTTSHVDSSFSDVFKQLDFAFATTFEASKGRWRFLLDENYINLGTVGSGPLGRRTVEIEPTLNFLEFGGSYAPIVIANKESSTSKPLPPTFSLEIVGGARYTHFGLGLEPSNSAPLEGSRNLVDAFIGNRVKVRPHPAVTISGKYTVGGGGSEFTWTAEGLVDFRFRKNMSAWGGYRVLDMNADQSANTIGFNGQLRGLIFGMTIHK